MSSPTYLTEPARDTPVMGDYDVLVLGGGPSGIMAAAAAARQGAKTLLVERYGFLGGMGTAAGVTNFCGLHANVHGQIQQVVQGLAAELLGRMRNLNGLNEPHLLFGGKIAAQAYDNAVYKVAADEMLCHSGVDLLFHTQAVGVCLHEMDPQRIKALLIESKSGRGALLARQFIDCSGDADLAAWAGAPFEKGSGAEDLLYPSTMFRLNGVDPARAGDAWNHFGQWMAEAEKAGQHFPRKSPIIRPQKNPTEWRANVTQLSNPDGTPVDGTNVWQMSAAELQGRSQVVDFLGFLRRWVPGFENSYLLEIAPQVGVRETRRVMGHYQLSEDDVLQCASFDDSIGVNGWPIEAHVAGDVVFKFQDIPNSRGYNQLPWRMLVPRQIDNLLVAGRCASMTHMGQSAARVSGPCFAMGQAVGTAAALALKSELPLADLSIKGLQRALLADGAFLGP